MSLGKKNYFYIYIYYKHYSLLNIRQLAEYLATDFFEVILSASECFNFYDAGEKVDLVDHLLRLNIGKLYIKAHQRNKYGYLSVMASSSKRQLGALMAESYCEQVISVGNMMSTNRKLALNDDELEMLVILKMDKDFIQFMCNNHAHEIKKTFGQRFNKTSISGL